MNNATNAIFKGREGVVKQRASTSLVLLDIESGEYYTLNEVGDRVWELCDGSRSIGEVIGMISREYDASEDIITADVQELLEELVSANLLVEVSH